MQKKQLWLFGSAFIVLLLFAGLGVTRQPQHTLQQQTIITFSAKAQAATPSPTPVPGGLTVVGTQLVNQAGQTVTLVGAARSSLEYSCDGDGHFDTPDFAAMRAWGMNVVRLTVSSEWWADHDNACPDYQQTVYQAAIAAETEGLYVIIDLQWNAPLNTAYDTNHGGAQCSMPDDTQDVAFWRDVAALFHDDHRVIFDLFGEPHDVNWNVWYNGGVIPSNCYVIQPNAKPLLEQGAFHAIGMKQLVAIVRVVAPQNILMVSGLDWGYDLSQVEKYPLNTTNILYDTHPFNYSGKQPQDWAAAFGNLAQRVPIIVGEFGSYDCDTSYIGQAIAYFNARHISWIVWAWNTGSCTGPTIIANWGGTPTAPYGQYIHDQMRRITNALPAV